MRILYKNRIDGISASSFTALSESASYPITNVQDERLSTIYKSMAVTAQSIIINLEAAYSINTIAIISHNFTSSATITISANSSDSWPGATTETITYNANMILKFITDQTYQYWKLSIDDPTNSQGYLSIGRIWLGSYLTVSPSSLIDFSIEKINSDIVDHSINRQKFSTPGYTWRKFNLVFPNTNYTMVSSIETMFDEVGNHSSIIFCNFDTDRNYPIIDPCYCSINNKLEFVHSNRMYFSYKLELEEEL